MPSNVVIEKIEARGSVSRVGRGANFGCWVRGYDAEKGRWETLLSHGELDRGDRSVSGTFYVADKDITKIRVGGYGWGRRGSLRGTVTATPTVFLRDLVDDRKLSFEKLTRSGSEIMARTNNSIDITHNFGKNMSKNTILEKTRGVVLQLQEHSGQVPYFHGPTQFVLHRNYGPDIPVGVLCGAARAVGVRWWDDRGRRGEFEVCRATVGFRYTCMTLLSYFSCRVGGVIVEPDSTLFRKLIKLNNQIHVGYGRGIDHFRSWGGCYFYTRHDYHSDVFWHVRHPSGRVYPD